MTRSQAITNLSILLGGMMSESQSHDAIARALRSAGLVEAPEVSEHEMHLLLQVLGADGDVPGWLVDEVAMPAIAPHETAAAERRVA